MTILQLANDYYGTALYQQLFQAMYLERIKSVVAVPLPTTGSSKAQGRDGEILNLPCFSALDRLLFYPKQKKFFKALQRSVRMEAVDVVHAHTLFSTGYCARLLKQKYGMPYIVAVRNTDVNVFFKKMPHLRKPGVEVMRHAQKVVFLSTAYQDAVLERYVPAADRDALRRKSVVIPNGISQLFFERINQPKALPASGVIRLIYVGELSSNKNLELTVQAAELLRRQGAEVSITAVGAILEEKYRALIEETPFLTHHDRCPQEEVIAHLRNADIFVMPSHAETFGLVYAEAMSQGLPVLYTRGQGFDGQFPGGTVGYAVSDRDAGELAAKIRAVMDNYAELSANCVRLVDKFDWGFIAKRYKELYLAAAGEYRDGPPPNARRNS